MYCWNCHFLKLLNHKNLLSLLALLGLLTLTIAVPAPASAQQIALTNLRSKGLPPCNLDSFVSQAGFQKEEIYGDEGVGSKPPLKGFTKASRINAGITGQRNAGLTTGHGSYLPDAWGRDEFTQAHGEWDISGAAFGSIPDEAVYEPIDNTRTKETQGSATGVSITQLRSGIFLPSLPSPGQILQGLPTGLPTGLPGF